MGVFQNNLMGAAAAAASAGGGDFYTHQIANSFRWESGYLKWTPGSAGNRQTWTFSCWVKKTENTYQHILNAGTAGHQIDRFVAYWNEDKLSSSSMEANFNSSAAVYRDSSAWQHIVWKLSGGTSYQYVNNVLASSSSVSGDVAINNNVETTLGISGDYDASSKYTGYMAEVVFIDGTALDPDSFAETKNGVWIPSDPSGLTFGSQGYYLDFADASDPGNDVSGNNNDWTNVSLATHDQMTDSPTFNSDSNGGNFATLNPLNTRGTTAVATQLTEGNLMWTPAATQDESSGIMSIGAGGVDKVYMEVYCVNNSDTGWFGAYDQKDGSIMNAAMWSVASSVLFKPRTGQKVTAGTSSNYIGDGSASDPSGVIFQMAVDVPAGKIWWGKNNAWGSDGADHIDDDNVAFTTLNTDGTYLLFTHTGGASVAQPDWVFNFGQDGTFAGNKTAGGNADDTGYGNFFYAPPTGFLAVCSGNISTAAAVDPAQTDDNYPQKLFAPKLYTGDGATTLTISGMDLQPDLTWIKNRDAADGHCWFDSTRGVTKLLASDSSAVESTDADTLKSWTSDGYTVGADVKVNTSGEDYASWNWRANGGTTSANAVGDLASVVQVDPSGGFSIVTYTGTESATTVGHGLSSAPQCIIVKCRDFDRNWAGLFVNGPGNGKSMILNSTSDGDIASGYWNNTDPTSTLFSIGGGTETNKSGKLFVAYCFANIEGYIKAGIYTGNADDDGTFVYTGFRPAMMILREYGAVDDWGIYDDKRLGYNLSSAGNALLYPNTTQDEENQASRAIDILSNGFKLRTSNATFNAGSGTYIYLAMAHNPFQYATAR